MDKQAAAKIIRDTFQNPFDKRQFVHFVKNLLNRIDETKAFHIQGHYVPESFRDYVKSYERIGTYADPQDNKIDILAVYLQKESALERARTTQRNFVARYLKDRGDKEVALVAFVPPDIADWRFSLVKMEYYREGGTKIRTQLTPARRWSFLVGKNESSHTAQSQLIPILQDDVRDPTMNELEAAFNIEKVTREFFEKYRELYHKVRDALEHELHRNTKARSDFEAKGVDTVNFSKKLLGQAVFLYFLQKKGWFGVSRDEQWGTGAKDFLRRLFQKEIAPYDNFFNDVLEPLFYEALASERVDDFYSRFNCKIPFLNGGLFDPINNYDWVHTDILLSNELFSNTIRMKEGDTGTGILDVFDRYNFTVKEDEPLEKDVAVDPEMLGKVFENLLEVKDRKSRGTYYTPREIVHYMCQESLINYLDAAVNIGDVPLVTTPPPQGKLLGKPDPEQAALKTPGYRVIVMREDIETLVRMGELAVEHDARVESVGRETRDYSYKLPQAIRWNAQLIDDKLADIRICDPAIGSGAFPVGMMTEIVRARNTLTIYLSDREGRTKYNFKCHAIQNCLYGVDIDLGAVEIAKLRLWLSLVVDEEDITQIRPLPNLDYKIMQGSSLIEDFHGISLAFGENGKGRPKLFEQDSELLRLVENLHRKQDSLFNATHLGEKEQQKAQVENAIVDIFHHELKRQRTTYFQLLENIERRACQIPNVEDRHKYYKAEKATLDNKSGFDFEALERELREMTHGNKLRPFFPWKLYFANVFREKGGFDLVIANPPYLGEKGHKETFREIKKANLGRFYQGKMNIFYFFFHLAINLGNSDSQVAFITTNYYPTALGAGKLRRDFKERTIIRRLIDFNEFKIFEAALGQNNMVTILSKGQNQNAVAETCITTRTGIATAQTLQTILDWQDEATNYHQVSQHDLYDGEECYIRLTGGAVQSEDLLNIILERLQEQGKSLRPNFCDINNGIHTEADYLSQSKFGQRNDKNARVGDGIYVLDRKNENDSYWINQIEKSPRERKYLKPFYKNSDVSRYWTNTDTQKRVIYINKREDNIDDLPQIKKHLYRFKRITEASSDNSPYLHRPKNKTIFVQPKIVAPHRSNNNTFGYNEISWYAASDVFFITAKDNDVHLKYILALLNSKLYYVWLYYKGKRKGETLELITTPLSEIPIKRISVAKQKPFIDIVDQILAITKDEDYLSNLGKQDKVKEFERWIDQMVYELYGLTSEEIAVVEGISDK